MQPLSGNQRPDLLTSLMSMSLVLRLPRKMHLSESSSNVPRLALLVEMLENHHVLLTFGKVRNPMCLPRKTTSEPSKVVRACCAFNILTWNTPQRHALFRHLNFQKSSEHVVLRSVQFFIFHLALASLLFDPSEPQDIGKTW